MSRTLVGAGMALVLALVAFHAPSRAVAPAARGGEAQVVLTNVLDDNGQALCGGAFEDTDALLRIRQQGGETQLALVVRNARPNTAYSVWLRLADLSPFTGLPFTAAVHTSDVPGLVPITPDSQLLSKELGPGDDGTGGPQALNGFYTDGRGNGEWKVTLDFPLVGGAYQWQRGEFAAAHVVRRLAVPPGGGVALQRQPLPRSGARGVRTLVADDRVAVLRALRLASGGVGRVASRAPG